MTSLLARKSDRAAIAGAPYIRGPLPSITFRIERLLGWIIAAEFLAVAGACIAINLIYFSTVLAAWPGTSQYIVSALVLACLVQLVALSFKQHLAVRLQPRDRYMLTGMGAVTLAFSLFLSVLFVFKIAESYSRGTLLLQFLGAAAAMLVMRGATHSFIRDAMQSGAVAARRALLLGDAAANSAIIDNLRHSGIRMVGILPMPEHNRQPSAGPALPSGIRNFVERCRDLRPDDVMILARAASLPSVAQLVDALSELPALVHVIPTDVNALWRSAKITNFDGTMAIQVLHPPLSLFDQIVKRAFDICVASLALLLLSPLLCMVSLAIRFESRGPIFFRQNRHGYNNEVINVIKFRTMKVAEDGETAETFTQASMNDDRVTPFGRILRRTNIDELPQLLNVLRGEMSIVGPRPHPLALNMIFHEQIAPFSRRHNVKPGLTGWAQVNGFRGPTDTDEKMQRRIEYDLYYIDNWSLMFDFKIILMTFFSRSSYTNAY